MSKMMNDKMNKNTNRKADKEMDRERNEIRLVVPTIKYKEKVLQFKKEFSEHNEDVINGSELLDKTDSYEEWLQSVTNNADRRRVNPEWVLTDTYFAVDAEDEIVGIIDLRHELNDFLKDIGNCGYSVRPSARGKGCATEMLRLIIEAARKAGLESLQLSVERNNEPSVKTIVKNGGIYRRSFAFEGETADVYEIRL